MLFEHQPSPLPALLVEELLHIGVRLANHRGCRQDTLDRRRVAPRAGEWDLGDVNQLGVGGANPAVSFRGESSPSPDQRHVGGVNSANCTKSPSFTPPGWSHTHVR